MNFSLSPQKLHTFGIITFNRVDCLRRVLREISAIATSEDEIIVVNNASTDSTIGMIREEYPNVHLVTLPENIGTAARNVYFPLAKGKYVWTLDDDTYPSSRQLVDEVERIFGRRQDIGAVCLNYFIPEEVGDQHLSFAAQTSGFVNDEWMQFALSGDVQNGYEGFLFVNGGGMVIRSNFLSNELGYDRDLFWGSEEMDFGLQLWRLGCSTVFFPRLYNIHLLAIQNRDIGRAYILRVRNTILVFYKHFSALLATSLTFVFILRRALAAIIHPQKFIGIMEGVVSAARLLPRMRKKISKFSYDDFWKLRRWWWNSVWV